MNKELTNMLAIMALCGVVFIFASLFVVHNTHSACPFSLNSECTPTLASGMATAMHHLASVSTLLGGIALSAGVALALVAGLFIMLVQQMLPPPRWLLYKEPHLRAYTYTDKLLGWFSLQKRAPALVNIQRT